MRGVLVTIAVALATLSPAAAEEQATPYVEGPDIPPATAAEVVTALDDVRFECSERRESATIAVPDGAWDRIVVVATITPDGDPWDRLFGVAIGGVEVLRGTTPRTEFTLHKDVTEYARLLPPGGEAEVSLYMGSYVGALLGTVQLEFYAGEPTSALVRAPRDVIGAFAFRGLDGDGGVLASDVTFPAAAPAAATVEITLSGHGKEEFWFPGVPRYMHILVDGVEVAVATPMPYVYALLGFGNENANTACVGPGTSADGDLLHPLMWWTAQQALDIAGVHTGDGEIPPYRAELSAEALALLTGAREIKVIQENGAGRWVTSLSFLLG